MIVIDDLLAGRTRVAFASVMVLVAFAVSLDHVIDLVAVAPVALAVQGLCSVRLAPLAAARLAAIVGGAAMVALWAALLLHGDGSLAAAPALAWALAIATANTTLTLARRLARTPVPSAFQSIHAAYETEPSVVAARLA